MKYTKVSLERHTTRIINSMDLGEMRNPNSVVRVKAQFDVSSSVVLNVSGKSNGRM